MTLYTPGVHDRKYLNFQRAGAVPPVRNPPLQLVKNTNKDFGPRLTDPSTRLRVRPGAQEQSRFLASIRAHGSSSRRRFFVEPEAAAYRAKGITRIVVHPAQLHYC